MRVYVSGPLFSEAEQSFNDSLAVELQNLGFQVFLPQRDAEGLRTPYSDSTLQTWKSTVFDIEVRAVLDADIFLMILDGRVPDEGACVELGIAFQQKQTQQPHKRLIGIMTDIRSTFRDARLNPMVAIPLEYIAPTRAALVTALRDLKHLA
jgi:nucleoside 2-deoxyribosyltransferase